MKHIISSQNAPAALGPYNHAIEHSNLVFVSGQIGIDPATGKLQEGLEAQALQMFQNLKNILAAANSSMEDVLKCTLFLTDMQDFAAVNKIYGNAFEKDFPARSCIEVGNLPGGALVEIEAIAIKGS